MQDHGFGLPRILLPRTRVNRQEEGRATTRRLPPTWCEIPVVAIPDKRGILIVVLSGRASPASSPPTAAWRSWPRSQTTRRP